MHKLTKPLLSLVAVGGARTAAVLLNIADGATALQLSADIEESTHAVKRLLHAAGNRGFVYNTGDLINRSLVYKLTSKGQQLVNKFE